MDWKIGFYWWDFIDISDIIRPRKDIKHWLSNVMNIGKIFEILTIYQFEIEKSMKKSSVRPINQWKNPAWVTREAAEIKILEIYHIYCQLGNIEDFFESFFKKYLSFFIF